MSDTERLSPTKRAEDAEGGAALMPEIAGIQILAKQDETSVATVWHALQVSLDREVSVWVMRAELTGRPNQVVHFETVARAVARIRHPNLVQVIDVSRMKDGTPYVVFENVDGATLASVLRMERKLDPNRALRIAVEIAKVLDFAWKQCGFIHRNIKPETILMGSADAVKLTHFSTATLVKPGENPLAYDENLVVGTPNYASPEQIECLRTIDFHSDMYSTGALLYRLITGVTPFGDITDPMAVFDLQRSGTLTHPRDLDPAIKPGVVHIIQKMMAKAPDDRYMWWQDALEDMQRVLSGRPPYLESANYVPPLSTIARPRAEPVPASGPGAGAVGNRRVRIPKRTAVAASGSAGGARPSSARAPGGLARLIGIVLIGVLSYFVMRIRIDQLEGSATDSAPREIASPSNGAGDVIADDEAERADDPGVVSDSGFAVDRTEDRATTDTGGAYDRTPNLPRPETPTERVSRGVEPGVGDSRPVPAVSAQMALVGKIYRAVREHSLDEARNEARKHFQASRDVEGIDKEQSQQIWQALTTAIAYEDLVGVALAGTPRRRTLQVGGRTFDFSPSGYMNGELLGTLHLEDGTERLNQRVPLSEMRPEEMYDCVLASVTDTSRGALLARAFLTMKMGDRGAFSIWLKRHELTELEPFMDVVGK